MINAKSIVDLLSYVEPTLCAGALVLMHRRGQLRTFKPLALFLATRILSFAIYVPLFEMSNRVISAKEAYKLYFYIFWTSYAVEAVLGFLIIYGVYNLAMAPLQGLQRLGTLMFRWAGGIAVAIAITMAFGPHVTSNKFIIGAVSQLQQTQSILTLCMLLFVCLAIRPMGLSYRSKIFGISLGLGVISTIDLAGSAWLSKLQSMHSIYGVISGSATCVALVIWSAYFAMPEPKRRMIILPTTSPFLRWNQISLALGDEPGFVAVGEVTPDMFAPAEVEVMRRASIKIRAQTEIHLQDDIRHQHNELTA